MGTLSGCTSMCPPEQGIRQFRPAMWLLGIEFRTSGKVVSIPNHCTISPVPDLQFLKPLHTLEAKMWSLTLQLHRPLCYKIDSSEFSKELLQSPAWSWKGLHDMIPTPGTESAGCEPPQMLTVISPEVCLYKKIYTFYFMFLLWEIFSLPRLWGRRGCSSYRGWWLHYN